MSAATTQRDNSFQTRLKEAAGEANSPISSEDQPNLLRVFTEILFNSKKSIGE